MKKCYFWVLAVIQGFRANVWGELGCTCVVVHRNTWSLLLCALLSDRHLRAVSCCFIAVGQSYRVPLQASQSLSIYEVNKGCWKWAFLPHSLGDLRCKRQLGLGKSYFVNAVSDIFSLLAVVGNLFCHALILSCLIFTLSLFSPLLYGCIVWLARGPVCA